MERLKGQKMMCPCNYVLSCIVHIVHVPCMCVSILHVLHQHLIMLPLGPFNFPFFFFFFQGRTCSTTCIDLFARVWMHLAQQQGSIHILACSLWFITVHNGGGTTLNTAEVRILPYGVRRENEQPYGSTGQGLNTSVRVSASEK